MIRAASALLAALAVSGCSTDPNPAYFEELEGITRTMHRISLAAMPNPAEITRQGVTEVTQARADAAAALEALEAPDDLFPEHSALVLALNDLVDASEAFLTDTSGLDPEAFASAVLASSEIDVVVERVATACDAMRRRAADLGIPVDLAC